MREIDHIFMAHPVASPMCVYDDTEEEVSYVLVGVLFMVSHYSPLHSNFLLPLCVCARFLR